MQKREERLQIMLDAQELRALDDFRFKVRMPSRASAVRELIRRGLAAEGFALAEEGQRSTSFGVLDGGSSSEEDGHL
jgi:metal-responsive CopG/Arc/MetJ family transcriptional regulator